jgi:hypothetical protein
MQVDGRTDAGSQEGSTRHACLCGVTIMNSDAPQDDNIRHAVKCSEMKHCRVRGEDRSPLSDHHDDQEGLTGPFVRLLHVAERYGGAGHKSRNAHGVALTTRGNGQPSPPLLFYSSSALKDKSKSKSKMRLETIGTTPLSSCTSRSPCFS